MTNFNDETLTVDELDGASGGDPVLLGIAIGIGTSIVASAIYDKMKDAHGISDLINQAKNQQK